VARARARLAEAEAVRARTLDGPEVRKRWQEAVAAIADPSASPRYGGLALAPQIGLVPLGPDPDSGLWEFLLEPSGAEPPRDAAGHLVPQAGSGIVLVLVPGGAYIPREEEHIGGAPEDFEEFLLPPRTVEPCLLSKWELTQAQWARLGGPASSYFRGDLHPVESVSWPDADLVCRRAGLELPTHDAWVHAMLAENDGAWWFDEPPADLAGHFGVDLGADAGMAPTAFGPPELCAALAVVLGGDLTWFPPPVSSHVVVGGFPPNPFGLHDLLGNVEEWLQDASPDGRRRLYRGGSFVYNADDFAVFTRASQRPSADPQEAYPFRGVRPMRRLDAIPP
jgi:formylglycine-generating enzyme required for sulfatase activity